jgi:hypothetical protein
MVGNPEGTIFLVLTSGWLVIRQQLLLNATRLVYTPGVLKNDIGVVPKVFLNMEMNALGVL